MKFKYLVLGLLLTQQVQAFSDISDSLYQESITHLSETGIINGYSDETFRPKQPINRAEFLKILLETKFKGQVSVYQNKPNTCFNEFPSGELWYKVYACVAKDRGIIQGFPDGSFRGADTITKAQAVKILHNVYFTPLTTETSVWYEGYYQQLKQKNLLLDLFDQAPSLALTRGEMAFAIQQFNHYPGHLLAPKQITIESVSTDVSPLTVVTSPHPGQKVTGGYINSYAQWQKADYPASKNNYTGPHNNLSKEVLTSVNNARTTEMRYSQELQDLAQNFAAHLVINGIYSHSDKLGKDPFDRAKLAGIEGFVAESIVWRNRAPVQAIEWWKKSQIHWNNVSNTRFTRAGVGIAQEPSGSYIVVLLQGE